MCNQALPNNFLEENSEKINVDARYLINYKTN